MRAEEKVTLELSGCRSGENPLNGVYARSTPLMVYLV